MSGSVEHQLYLYSPTGMLLTIIPDDGLASLSYGFKDMEPGVLEFTLSPDFDLSLLAIDGQVEVYRRIEGMPLALEGDTAFFIRRVRIGVGRDGVESLYVKAFSALSLVKRRIIAYYAGASYSEKISYPFDNMLRLFMRENYGALAVDPVTFAADPTRDLSPWLAVEADTGWGPAATKSAAWRVMFNTIQDVIKDVRSAGTYCTLDIVRTSPAHYEFRVYLGARGVDHSAGTAQQVIVSRERLNLAEPLLDLNWEDEKNFIYGTGQGQQDQRIVETAQDDARIGVSPFNRQEFVQDARMTGTVAATVQAEANSALEENRPKRTFTGKITQTDGCLYGVHWKWGDIVTAEYRGLSIDCHVDAVTVSVDGNGTEHVEGNLRSVEDV